MTTLNPRAIDSWEQFSSQSAVFSGEARGGIDTTSSALHADPKWDQCIDALLLTWKRAPSAGPGAEPSPNGAVIEAALQWLMFLRERFPAAPPTLVGPEPDGGLIIERRDAATSGGEILEELTLYRDQRAEMTLYLDGKVKEMAEIPFKPPVRRNRPVRSALGPTLGPAS